MHYFEPWTSTHVLWLGISVVQIALPLAVARCGWCWLARWIVGIELVWAASGVVLLITERGSARWLDVLPLHLCDLVVGIVAIAFVWRHPLAFELAYCYGLAGSIQALLTPDIAGSMPLWRLAYFFGAHAAVIAAVLYLTAVERLRPRPGTIGRAIGGLAIYAATLGAFNALAGTNYGYLCSKPTQPSLLDVLGPWPWYILAVGAIGTVCFWLLLLPFRPNRSQ